MPKPPKTPPTEDRDADRHRHDRDSPAHGSAEQVEHARSESKGRPSRSKS